MGRRGLAPRAGLFLLNSGVTIVSYNYDRFEDFYWAISRPEGSSNSDIAYLESPVHVGILINWPWVQSSPRRAAACGLDRCIMPVQYTCELA